MTKTKWHTKAVYLLVALAMVLSFGMTMAPVVPAVQADDPPVGDPVETTTLTVGVTPIPTQLCYCQNVTVNVTITNQGPETANLIYGNITFPEDQLERVSGPDPGFPVYSMSSGEHITQQWVLHCIAGGVATIEAWAQASNSNNATGSENVTQKKAHLVAEVSATNYTPPLCVCSNFTTMVTVNNTGTDCALNVSPILEVTGNANCIGPDHPMVEELDIGEIVTWNWTCHCTGLGPVTLNVTGIDAIDCCTLEQVLEKNMVLPSVVVVQEGPELEVAIDPIPDQWPCNNFTVNATVTNTGNCTAYCVNATISIDPSSGAHLISGGDTQPLGTIGPVCGTNSTNWTLHCDEPGAVNITVEATSFAAVNCTVPVDPVSNTTTVQQLGPQLGIKVCPPCGDIFCGDSKKLIVTVNSTGGLAQEVVVTASVPLGAPATVTPPMVELGGICDGCEKKAIFTVNCTGVDGVDVTFTATAANGDTKSVTVHCNQNCRFDVDITSPQDGEIVHVCDYFGVAVNITNNTDEYCGLVSVTLDIDGQLELVGGSLTYNITLPAGETEEVNWSVHCNATGEVDLTVTAVGCGQDGECAEACADTITIYQEEPGPCTPHCDFTYEILDPVWDCDEDICVCENFTVKALVTNLGDACGGNITGQLEMRATGSAEPVSTNPMNFGPIAPGGNQTLVFTWHCYDAGANCNTTLPLPDLLFQSGVDFEARAWGQCEGPPGGSPVLMPKTPPSQGWSHYWPPASTVDDYINQTWIDLKLFDDYGDGDPICTCRTYCDGDDILVYPRVRNCRDSELRNAAVWFLSMSGNISWEVGPKEFISIGDIAAGQTGTVNEAFHFKCTGTGEAWLRFKATGVYGEAETVCDIDEVNIHQKEAPDLEVELTADDCQQYCDNFNVTAVITNTGSEYSSPIAINCTENITLHSSGNVTPVGSMNCDCCGVGETIELDPGDSCTCEWEFHCSGPENAGFMVEVSGTSLCGNVSASDEVYVEQIMLDIEIITPEDCDTKTVSEDFCVTANITDNDDDTCFSGLKATISFPTGKADIHDGENYTKAFNITDGDTQQLSWTVHCLEPGDADIKVEVTGCASASQDETWSENCPCDEYCDCCELHNKYDIITIHQECELHLGMEIVSPDNLDTLVATSQDFAVSAVIVNNDQLDVTVTEVGLLYHPESGATIVEEPEVGFVIPAGGSERVTWTMHCEEPGLLTFIAYATAVSEDGCPGVVWTFPLLLWQYPAASLEVEILRVEPQTTITVCQNFTVFYQVNNTGAADATDVFAELSVTPEGSARPVEGIDSGYTQRIGTIPAGGSSAELQWRLHCKEACESTITITVEGNDEYGWHKKQECQSTGNFIIEAGCFGICATTGGHHNNYDGVPALAGKDQQDREYKAIEYGILFGESSGFTGPFNLNTPVSAIAVPSPGPTAEDYSGSLGSIGVGGDFSGNLVAIGAVIQDLPPSHYESLLHWLCEVDGHNNVVYLAQNNDSMDGPPCLLDLLEWIGMQGVNKDVMVFVGHLDMDELDGMGKPVLLDGCYDVLGGLIQVVNGHTSGAELTFRYGGVRGPTPELTINNNPQPPCPPSLWVMTMEDGEYCSTMAKEALRPINPDFIQSGTVTVKQLEPAQLVVEIDFPYEGFRTDATEEYKVTATISNIGEETAENVAVTLVVDDYADIITPDPAAQDIAGGDSVSVTWEVECLEAGFSVFSANATGCGAISGNAVEAFDTVTVKQGEVPLAQLVVEIFYPENGDEFIQGDLFPVTARIKNVGERTANDVEVSIDISANAENISGPSGTWPRDIAPTSSVATTWTLNCTAPGFSVITVEASGNSTENACNTAVDTVTIKQLPPPEPYLTVEVDAPAQVMEGSTYVVTAVVTNEGQADATGVNADIQVTGDADMVEVITPIDDDTIEAGDQAKAEWRVECTGSEDANISVEAEGDDTNFAIDSVAVKQIPITPYLTVEVDAPAQVMEGSTYVVTAVVTNEGQADATGVNADIQVTGDADMVEVITPIDDDTIGPGNSAKAEWRVECTGSEDANISVEVTSGNANAPIDSVAVKQIPIYPYLTVEVDAPAQVMEGSTYVVTAVVTNEGGEEATGVDADIEVTGDADVVEVITPIDNDTIGAGDSAKAEWRLECTGGEDVNISVIAEGDDTNVAIGSVAVEQTPLEPPFLELELTAPAQIPEDVMFTVCAVLSNTGDVDAENIEIWIEASNFTDPEGWYEWLLELPAGDSIVLAYDFLCTGEGGVNIGAEAAGSNTNVAAASIAVEQLAVWEGAWLWVDVTAPDWAYVDDDYYVTAVVNNFGDMKATDVDATLEILGDASTLDPLTQVIGDIDAGSSAEVSWMLTADAQGGVNVIVTALGSNTNEAIDAAAIQQGVIMWDNLVVTPTYGMTPLDITASADVSNSGNMATTTEAELYVDGEVVASQIVSLGAGAGRTVTFDCTLGVGTHYVTINGLPPVEVVVVSQTVHLYEGANPITYPGSDGDFPAVLTNIGPAGLDVTLIVWLRDVSTGGAWWFYNVPQDHSVPAQFTGMETDKVYIVVVSEDCDWYVS